MQSKPPIRVFICDDSLLVRSLMRTMLETDPQIVIVGEASNGKEAYEQVISIKPDIVTMDLEMPVMGGHEAIREIMSEFAVPIVVVSSLDDAQNAYKAISNGALEVIPKPQLEKVEACEFVKKIKMLAQIKTIKHVKSRFSQTHSSPIKQMQCIETTTSPKYGIFAIALSTGGPQTLEKILKAIPANFPCPIVVAQHISLGFAQGFAEWLNSSVSLNVKIAEDKEKLLPGYVYISPSDFDFTVSHNHLVKLSQADNNGIYHPNCDVLLKSIAMIYGKNAVGIICTGMSSDGVQGMESIHAAGGSTIAQDEQSSIVFGMNQVAISRNCIDYILPLLSIAGKMQQLCMKMQSMEVKIDATSKQMFDSAHD